MKHCKQPGCGSYQFNLWRDDIDQSDLCDVHYWKNKTEELERELAEQKSHSAWFFRGWLEDGG